MLHNVCAFLFEPRKRERADGLVFELLEYILVCMSGLIQLFSDFVILLVVGSDGVNKKQA